MLVDGSQAERGGALNHEAKISSNRSLKIRLRYVLRVYVLEDVLNAAGVSVCLYGVYGFS